MAYPDSTPSSSYSDPIYDRLDTVAQAVRRRWWIYVLALLIVILVSLLVRRQLNNRPDTASAAAFNRAFTARDETETMSRFKALAEDPKADNYYRARAWIELTQHHLEQDDANTAKTSAEHAVSLARDAKDQELIQIAKLSLAASEYQLQDFSQALADYADAAASLGARSPALELEATLGKARTQKSLNKLSDAATTLEPLLARTDANAKQQLDVAKLLYWEIRREMAQPKHPTASVVPTATPVSTAAAAPAASAPLETSKASATAAATHPALQATVGPAAADAPAASTAPAPPVAR